jgi:hypothetical protein
MTFKEMQDEVARRAVRNNSSQFTTAIKNAINSSLMRVGREAYWRVLRRKSTFDTVTSYTTGSGAVTATNNSKNVTITGATLITDDIQVGRLISLGGALYTIAQITGETTLVLDRVFDGTSTVVGTYEIYPQEEYNLPIQATHRCFLWHEDYGYPYLMTYMTDQSFFACGVDRNETGTPTHYRMWGVDMVIEQVKTPSIVSVVSSSSSDSTQIITIYGTVSGYPDKESITCTGLTTANGTKSFSSIERIVKSTTSLGRITVTANSGNTTLAVFPTGDTMDGIQYRKVQIWPLPDSILPINVYYYKDVYLLENDGDIHELGVQFDEAIILLATARIQLETGQQEGGNFAQLYGDEIKILKRTNVDKMDYVNILTRGGRNRVDPLIHPTLTYRQAGLSVSR